ncbi:MAG TPA: DUF1552 domain-containing protein [Gammaproteobacteria bacterium]|jgi:hypothetical protein|nr:DUF1552 domain-containing protein [Gammaproteobacteria bacterium]
MFITRKHLARRTFLKGLGATVALPLLDAMVPAFASNVKQPPRLGFVYVPHGMVMKRFTPATTGKGFAFTDITKSLEPYRNHLSIVSQLHHRAADTSAVHSLSPTTWLSGVRPKPTQGVDAYAGVTADQVAAAAIGQDTLLPSIELATEDHSGLIGACDRDYGCIYMNTLSWRTPTTPMPMEINPRKVFERMFGQGDSADARLIRRQEDRSILDAVTTQTTGLQRVLGQHDREMLDGYLEGVREIERRLQRAESQVAANADIEIPQAPGGIPFEYTEHVRLMFDLLALAYRADITRVFTFMMAREVSNRTYTQVGVSEGHHAVSHHQNKPEKLDMLARIQAFHIGLFGEFLGKLASTRDGDGSLLDHSVLLYGSNMSNSNLHDHYPLPNIVVGGGRGRLKGGQHIMAPEHTPQTNLLVTLLDKVDVKVDTLGDSTGRITEL